jgi:hypothetical protein
VLLCLSQPAQPPETQDGLLFAVQTHDAAYPQNEIAAQEERFFYK